MENIELFVKEGNIFFDIDKEQYMKLFKVSYKCETGKVRITLKPAVNGQVSIKAFKFEGDDLTCFFNKYVLKDSNMKDTVDEILASQFEPFSLSSGSQIKNESTCLSSLTGSTIPMVKDQSGSVQNSMDVSVVDANNIERGSTIISSYLIENSGYESILEPQGEVKEADRSMTGFF
jgi:hypothetical protein